jgi:hypothetical protein
MEDVLSQMPDLAESDLPLEIWTAIKRLNYGKEQKCFF